MSLYEQFFSDINKDFMFNMANNVLKKDHNITIEGDESIKEIYLQDMKDIFENNDFVELPDINKVLLDTTIKKNKNINNIGEEDETQEETSFTGYRKIDEDVSEKNEKDLSELIKERESLTIPPLNENEKNTTSIDELLKNASGTKIESIIEESPEIKEENIEIESVQESNIKPYEGNIEEKKEDVYVNNLKLVSFTSNKRTSINSSRYNYSVDLIKEGIDPEKLHSLSKLIIPIEDNYVFTLPILTLIIKELDMEVCLQQKDIIQNEYNTVGIYEPIENIIFDISYPLRKLSIDIRDISNIKYSSNDILKINIMEIKKNILILTCSKIDSRNFKKNDMIKIINIQTYDMYIVELLSNPLKIKAIKDNMVFCKVDGDHPDKVFNNIDMKILNISNQNMVYFNQYS
tara:strand:+ start:5578 stop:6792 length:1215 start_codon:yes stop_codon:yes gene_type:complete